MRARPAGKPPTARGPARPSGSLAGLSARPAQRTRPPRGVAGRLHARVHAADGARTSGCARAAPCRHLAEGRHQRAARQDLGLVPWRPHQPDVSAGIGRAPSRSRRGARMTAVAQVAAGWPRSSAPERPASMPLFPTLWPSMMRGAASADGLPFPLTDPGRREFTFARYGIYAVARALGLEEREVLFPAFFHCVELDALLAAGAKIALYPIGADLQLDPQAIADRIGPRTAALYVIHYAGFPAPIRGLRALCRDRGLALIEDCAHALLSAVDGEPLGSFGDAAVFSLPKSLPTPDGGIALRMGKAAYAATGAAYVPMGTPDFDLAQADTIMSALSRRILMRQDFAAIVLRRRRNYRYLLERLDDVAPPIVAALPEEGCPLFYPFRVARRDAVLARLRALSVPVGEFWPERHPMTPDGEFPGVNDLRATALWLPCHQDMTQDALEWLVLRVRQAVLGER